MGWQHGKNNNNEAANTPNESPLNGKKPCTCLVMSLLLACAFSAVRETSGRKENLSAHLVIQVRIKSLRCVN